MTPARLVRTIIASAVVACACSHGSHAYADTNASDAAAAEALFAQAKKLMADGKLDEACPKFAESNRLDSGIGTMLYLADCYEKSGKTASAWAMFKEAAEQSRKQGDAREKLARDRASTLEPNLSKLVVVVSDANRSDGIVITRDGTEVGAAQWSLELPIDPGQHRIAASAKGHQAWSMNVTVAAARTERVQIPALQPVVEDHPPPPPPNSGSGQRMVGIVTASVGLVGIGVGTAFGVRAKQKADDAAPYCTSTSCQQSGLDDWSVAKSSGNIATGFFIAGGVLLAAGALLYIIAPSNARTQSALVNVARGGFSF